MEGDDVVTFAEAQRAALAHRYATAVRQSAHGRRCHHRLRQPPSRAAPRRRTTMQRAAPPRLVLPVLGRHKLAALTTAHLTAWRDDLAQQPAPRPDAPRCAAALPRRSGDQGRHPGAPAQHQPRDDCGQGGAQLCLQGWPRRGRPRMAARCSRSRPVNAARPGHLTVAEAQRLINAAQGAFPQSGARRAGDGCALRRTLPRSMCAICNAASCTSECQQVRQGARRGADERGRCVLHRPDGRAASRASLAKDLKIANETLHQFVHCNGTLAPETLDELSGAICLLAI